MEINVGADIEEPNAWLRGHNLPWKTNAGELTAKRRKGWSLVIEHNHYAIVILELRWA